MHLDKEGICKATIESVLENGNDAIFAPLFWYCVAGAPGALFYRLVNTLDAMWGYRNSRYYNFGWCAARMDDLLNWLPARLTVLTYALSGKFTQGIYCWRTQAKDCESPNAGPVMASGAGALNIQLGGAAVYHGEKKEKPVLGQGNIPTLIDIERAIKLIKKALLLWLVCIVLIDVFKWVH
jgi:adenosylcobinamide-phosphate synthase